MSQSPASAAPPSNHCPRSEPADGKPWTHPLHSPLPDRGRMQSGLEGWPLELGSPLESWVDDNNISQGFNNIGHEVMHVPLEPSPRVLGTSKGNPHFESHKRKWEGIAENLNVIRGNASSRELEESLPVAPRNINLDSFEGSSSRNEKKVLPDEWSSNKRTRSNDVEIGSVSESKAPGQSPTLSAELWQHIFCFVPPVFLGRLLRVDHAFHTYLTQNKANEQEPKRESYNAVKPLGSEAIWASSRRRFGRGLPKPISGLLELDMWKLLRGRKCQVCGEAKASGLSFSADSPWEAGPGATGLRVVWPWGVRICGHCMQSCSEKVNFNTYRSTISSTSANSLAGG